MSQSQAHGERSVFAGIAFQRFPPIYGRWRRSKKLAPAATAKRGWSSVSPQDRATSSRAPPAAHRSNTLRSSHSTPLKPKSPSTHVNRRAASENAIGNETGTGATSAGTERRTSVSRGRLSPIVNQNANPENAVCATGLKSSSTKLRICLIELSAAQTQRPLSESTTNTNTRQRRR